MPLFGKCLAQPERYGALEDRCAPDRVGTALDGSTRKKVDGPAEQFGELVFHGSVIEQPRVGGRLEGHEDIDIAVRSKVVSDDGAEEVKTGYVPAVTEGYEAGLVNRDPCDDLGRQTVLRAHQWSSSSGA